MRSAANEGIVHRFGKAAATSPGSHGKLMTVWKRGPGSIEGPPLTQREVADKIRIVEETVGLLRQQGRSILAEALLDCARVFKILASDL